MLIGYACNSILDQVTGLEAQVRDLKAAGCEKVFCEQISANCLGRRPELVRAIDFSREGDVFVVTKLNCLAPSVANLCATVAKLDRKHVALRILALGVDTSTPTGQLVLQVLAAIAEFERAIMLNRQRKGIAKARAEGKYKGRAPTARAKSAEIIALASAGTKRQEIASRLGLSVASVYRALRAARISDAPDKTPAFAHFVGSSTVIGITTEAVEREIAGGATLRNQPSA